jgi:hypothetical protein
MAKKYTLQEARNLSLNVQTSRTSLDSKKKMFWDELNDIEQAVCDFADSMRDEMFDKTAEGYVGWDESENIDYIKEQLIDHVNRGKWLGAANFCMMLYRLKAERKDNE